MRLASHVAALSASVGYDGPCRVDVATSRIHCCVSVVTAVNVRRSSRVKSTSRPSQTGMTGSESATGAVVHVNGNGANHCDVCAPCGPRVSVAGSDCGAVQVSCQWCAAPVSQAES